MSPKRLGQLTPKFCIDLQEKITEKLLMQNYRVINYDVLIQCISNAFNLKKNASKVVITCRRKSLHIVPHC